MNACSHPSNTRVKASAERLASTRLSRASELGLAELHLFSSARRIQRRLPCERSAVGPYRGEDNRIEPLRFHLRTRVDAQRELPGMCTMPVPQQWREQLARLICKMHARRLHAHAAERWCCSGACTERARSTACVCARALPRAMASSEVSAMCQASAPQRSRSGAAADAASSIQGKWIGTPARSGRGLPRGGLD